MASTVSVTNIHSWLRVLRKITSQRSPAWQQGEGEISHLELLRLQHEREVEELAGR